MAEGTFQPFEHTTRNMNAPRAQLRQGTAQADHLVLIAGHAIKALIRDRGEPVTAAEHRALMRDAAMLAQMTWIAMQNKG